MNKKESDGRKEKQVTMIKLIMEIMIIITLMDIKNTHGRVE